MSIQNEYKRHISQSFDSHVAINKFGSQKNQEWRENVNASWLPEANIINEKYKIHIFYLFLK